ncbi:serine/threonine-protein kinase HipA [Collimonas sp. OK307]|uniref:HipA domain-containing protein n=1 Tax=Collimonas sp. OK307 TaxID=1801620 RepID=UPI0008E7F58D|nr:HipA domain-containing protein [Collimonas sp. OK307]SFI02928.1 serine/threonine-protein kinase HipA [Collimonas sp. OK307]
MRELKTYINSRLVGKLVDENGIWSFVYDSTWVAAPDAFPLSKALPLQTATHIDASSLRPVQWYFDNLLPEEGARALLAKDAKLDANDAFSLLGYYGAESAGSLILTNEDPALAKTGERALPDAELQTRIENLPTISLAANAPKRMSLAGAQHKLAVIYRPDALFEPIEATPSTYILKPNHQDADFRNSVINEYFTMQLAKAVGLDVPATYRKYVPSPVYLIERFDRAVDPRQVRRLHAIDACQLLNLDRQFKYTAASLERLAELAAACTAPALTRVRLFSWFVFNLLVGNNDAHLKNLSFLVDAQGVRLAPHYDMLATAVYQTKALDKDIWPKTKLSWPIFERESFEELDRACIIAAGQVLGLTVETATRLLDAQLKSVPKAADIVFAGIEEENNKLRAERPILIPVFGNELRTVRSIIFIIIKDMVEKLSQK